MGRPSLKHLGCKSYKCPNEHFSSGYCSSHYRMNFYEMKGKCCEVEGCENPARAKNRCNAHYKVLRKLEKVAI